MGRKETITHFGAKDETPYVFNNDASSLTRFSLTIIRPTEVVCATWQCQIVIQLLGVPHGL